MIWEQEPPQDSKFVPSTRLLDGAQAIVAAAPKYGIDPSSVPADLYAKYQAKQAQYHHFSEVRNPHNKWDDAGKLEGARVWTKIDGDYLMIHCELEIDVDLATLVPHFNDVSFRTKFDEKIKSMSEICRINDQVQLVQLHYKSQWPMNERECLFYRFGTYTNKDTYQMVGFEGPEISPVPAGPGVVRIDFDFMASTLTRVSPGKTFYSATSRVNPKVAVPKFMIKGRLKEGAEVYWKFKQAVE